jgi:hypothetical protein
MGTLFFLVIIVISVFVDDDDEDGSEDDDDDDDGEDDNKVGRFFLWCIIIHCFCSSLCSVSSFLFLPIFICTI